MPQQPQQQQGLSLIEQYRLIKWALKFPALTVMVFLRRRIGYRQVSISVLLTIAFVIIFGSSLATPGNEDGRPLDLDLFALLFVFFGICHRIRGLFQFHRNAHEHSRSVGISIFHFRWLPRVVRHNRLAERLVDPAVCILSAFMLFPHSRFLALYIGFAGFCLRGFEMQVHENERNQQLDIMDDLINSQAQAQAVEDYEQPPRARRQRTINVLPSGIGADIASRIKRPVPRRK